MELNRLKPIKIISLWYLWVFYYFINLIKVKNKNGVKWMRAFKLCKTEINRI